MSSATSGEQLQGGDDGEVGGGFNAVPIVEAILFGSDKPMPAMKISGLAELRGIRPVRQAVDTLNDRYEQVGSAFRIVELAGGYQVRTLPEYGDVLARLHKSRRDGRLSQAALETLAIVAYRQPILRADVEAIRGVACGEVLRGLMEKNLIRIAGRAEEIGRPLLYATTRQFLEVFGLAGLDDLPNAGELRKAAAQVAEEARQAQAEREAAAESAAVGESGDAPQTSEPPPAEAGDAPSSNSEVAVVEPPAGTYEPVEPAPTEADNGEVRVDAPVEPTPDVN